MDTALDSAKTTRSRRARAACCLSPTTTTRFAVRVLAARSATATLDLMYYLRRDDDPVGLLLKEIVAAADRGVKVRLLIDDINPRNRTTPIWR